MTKFHKLWENHKFESTENDSDCPCKIDTDNLFERKKSPTEIMYHGTSSNFLDSVLSQGLIPNPPKRYWDDGGDKPDHLPANVMPDTTVGGVYFSSSISAANNAAEDSAEKFGGTPMIVIAQIQRKSAYADEDDMSFGLLSLIDELKRDVKILRGGSEVSQNNYLFGYITALGQDASYIYDTYAKLINDKYGNEKTPPDLDGASLALNAILYSMFSKSGNYEKRLFDDGFSDGYHRLNKEDPTRRQLRKARPEIDTRSAYQLWIKAQDRLTRRYKNIATNYADHGGSSTLRLMEPVDYSGSNKIIGIITIPERGKLQLEYGAVPDSMSNELRRTFGEYEIVSDEQLDEFSAAGAGAVSGTPGPLGSPGKWVTKKERDEYNKKVTNSKLIKGK